MIGKIKRSCYLFESVFKKNVIPVMYYSDARNVGDLLNEELISRITGKKVVKPLAIQKIKHILGIGSIADSMNKNSIVWGSGLINESSVDKIHSLGDILCLRGHLTKKLIEKKFDIRLDHVVLGDPGLLVDKFYQKSPDKLYKFGVIPHYVDKHLVDECLINNMGGVVINVDLSIQDFIYKISECDMIVSSSMHGLIFSDSIGIPNKWVRFSDRVIGGDFKFNDYYSVTDTVKEEVFLVGSELKKDILLALNEAKVKYTNTDVSLILSSLTESDKC